VGGTPDRDPFLEEADEGDTMDDDEAEFRSFVTARWPSLVRTAYLITTDRGIAEDCVQEALVSVHRRWRQLDRAGNPDGYTRKAVVNAALSWRRRRRVREVELGTAEETIRPAAESASLGLGSASADVVAALRELPLLMRAAVALRYLEDRSESETASLLGCSLGTVKSATSRGIAKLRVVLAENDAPPKPGPTNTYTEGARS
jgi:RNA polymerase sigma-70 factor (sigma-E family)